jgi:drug/metabolite transporter (DMT)-like permease
MSVRAWSLIAILSVLWGGTFLFNRVAVVEVPPFTVVFIRVALAAVVLFPLVGLNRLRLPTGVAAWRDFAVMGILNNVAPFVLIVWAQAHIPGGLASILNALTPLFAVVCSHFLTADDKATPNKVIGVLLGLAGVAVLVGPGVLAQAGDAVLAELAVVAATFSYGLSSVWSRRFRGRPPLVTSTGQLIASSVMLAPLAVLVDRPWTLALPGMATLGSLAALALLSTALAYVLFFRVVTLAGPSNAMLVTLLIPVSAILLTATLLGERLALHQFLGMAVIASGLIAVDGRLARYIGQRRVSRSGEAG